MPRFNSPEIRSWDLLFSSLVGFVFLFLCSLFPYAFLVLPRSVLLRGLVSLTVRPLPYLSLPLPMDQFTELLASKFSLTTGETDLIAADPSHAANPTAVDDLSLIGLVVTDKELSINFIRANALRLLHPVKGAEIRSIGTNTFVIRFNHPLDRMKALRGCPWVLDKYALILEPIHPNKKHEDHVLTRLPIMVRVFQLSLANRSEQVARLLGNSLGEFVEVPKETDSHYSPYFRIKIYLDITKVLKRGLNFQGVDGKRQWLPVAYERLPLFCFLCGILGHGEVDCPTRYEEGFIEPAGTFSYGGWLRVATGDRVVTGARGSGGVYGMHGVVSNLGRTGAKMGANIFNFTARDGGDLSRDENSNPNLVKGAPRLVLGAEKHLTISDSSGESTYRDGRKKIHIPSKKRKAAESVLGEIQCIGKKSQLQLRDEELLSEAETTEEQSRLMQ